MNWTKENPYWSMRLRNNLWAIYYKNETDCSFSNCHYLILEEVLSELNKAYNKGKTDILDSIRSLVK